MRSLLSEEKSTLTAGFTAYLDSVRLPLRFNTYSPVSVATTFYENSLLRSTTTMSFSNRYITQSSSERYTQSKDRNTASGDLTGTSFTPPPSQSPTTRRTRVLPQTILRPDEPKECVICLGERTLFIKCCVCSKKVCYSCTLASPLKTICPFCMSENKEWKPFFDSSEPVVEPVMIPMSPSRGVPSYRNVMSPLTGPARNRTFGPRAPRTSPPPLPPRRPCPHHFRDTNTSEDVVITHASPPPLSPISPIPSPIDFSPPEDEDDDGDAGNHHPDSPPWTVRISKKRKGEAEPSIRTISSSSSSSNSRRSKRPRLRSDSPPSSPDNLPDSLSTPPSSPLTPPAIPTPPSTEGGSMWTRWMEDISDERKHKL